MVSCPSQARGCDRTADARGKICSHSGGTHSNSRGDLADARGPDRRNSGAKLMSLGHYFPAPGFTDEHCYFFLARPVRKTAAGAQHDDTEAIIDCREFSADVLREMIAEGEIRDANTLSIWARLVARGEIFP